MITAEEIQQCTKPLGNKIIKDRDFLDDSGINRPLPETHWIHQTDEHGGCGKPPMPFRMGTDNPERERLAEMIREAGKYAVRASTGCGDTMVLNPDILLENLIIALLGYYTSDGL